MIDILTGNPLKKDIIPFYHQCKRLHPRAEEDFTSSNLCKARFHAPLTK